VKTYIARRLLALLPVALVVATVAFVLMHLAPGDPASVIAGPDASADDVRRISQQLGLDAPLPVQLVRWYGRLVRGDLGQSIFLRKPVTEAILDRVEPTLALATATIILTVAFAIPLGVLAAWKRGTWIDRAVMGLSVLGFSVPVFVIGYILIYLFAIELAWLPVQGYQRLRDGLTGFVERLILPSATLAVVFVALIARITRASVLEVLNADHVRTARAKGLGELPVLVRHVLRNAAVPIITVIGIGIAVLIGGVVVTESVYGIPGLGRLTVDAVLARDYPTVQAVILLFSVAYVLINLIVDLSYTVLDPRIRY
jgi:peptide/nickel transport system permease protein